jgi:hypothetical protein
MGLVIAIDDPRADDVQTMLRRHLAFAREVTPSGHVHALEVDDLGIPRSRSLVPAETARSSGSARSNSWMRTTPS